MSKTRLFAIRALLILCVGAYPLALSAAPRIGSYKAGEILVRFEPGAPARGIAASAHTTVRKAVPQIDTYCLRLPPGLSVPEAIEKFSRNPNVIFASANHTIYLAVFPNDDWFDFQWGLYNTDGRCDIHAPEAWDLQTGSANTIIAIVDTGIESTHLDLYGKVLQGYNAIDGTTNTEDDHMHGTFVAGIAGAITNNFDGVAGVDWNARLLPVKIMDSTGQGEEIDAAEGVVWAVDHGAKIINLSVGTYLNVPAFEAAINYAWGAGAVVVCASGNDGLDDASYPHYPSYYSSAISVGASNEYDERCTDLDWGEGGSNYGDTLDVMAPGNWIFSTAPFWYEGLFTLLFGDYGYEFGSGTSAATPFVSGLAGLIWASHPGWTNLQVRNQIEQTCDDIDAPGKDRYTGWGRINAYRALSEAFEVYPTIRSLRAVPNGTIVSLPERPVTAGTTDFTDRFYVEDPDRTAGIMVYYGPTVTTPTSIGNNVQVSGTLSLVEGKRAITNPTVSTPIPGSAPKALAMVNKSLGGAIDSYEGVTSGIGLANTGLLVRSWGRVTAVGWNYFYMDDGSAVKDGSGLIGSKVYTGSLTRPAARSYVIVTGISTFEIPYGTTIRIPVLRPRQQSDILPIPE